MKKTDKKAKSDGLREFVFYLEKIEHPSMRGFNGFTRTLWAKDAEEATKRMEKSWGDQMGYSVKYLYPMDEFQERVAAEEAKNSGKKAVEAQKPEVESV